MIQKENEEERLWVDGLEEAFYECYNKGILPSEGSFSWARAGRAVDLRDYNYYPGGIPSADRADKKEN
jgi:hypothetical protein